MPRSLFFRPQVQPFSGNDSNPRGSQTHPIWCCPIRIPQILQVLLRCCHRLLLPAMKATAQATEGQLIPDFITLRVAMRHLLVWPSDQYSLRAHFFNSPQNFLWAEMG